MKTIRYHASVVVQIFKIAILAELEYPFMLIGHVLANSIQWVVGFTTIKFVVDQFGSIGGWGYESLAFLYGMSVLQHGLAVVLYIQTWYMGYMVILFPGVTPVTAANAGMRAAVFYPATEV